MGVSTDPPKAGSFVGVLVSIGLSFRWLNTFSGSTLASAPVSSLNVILFPRTLIVESHMDSEIL